MSEYINLGDVTYFGITITHPSGGMLVNADETPRYFLYKNASDTPLISANFVQRASLVGTYRGSGDITAGVGFAVGDYVEVHASGKVSGLVGRSIIKTFVVSDTFNVNVNTWSGVPVNPLNNGNPTVNVASFTGVPLATSINPTIQNAVWGARLSNLTTNDTTGSGLWRVGLQLVDANVVRNSGHLLASERFRAIQSATWGARLSSLNINDTTGSGLWRVGLQNVDANVVRNSGHLLANQFTPAIQQAVWAARMTDWTTNNTTGSGLGRSALNIINSNVIQWSGSPVQQVNNGLPPVNVRAWQGHTSAVQYDGVFELPKTVVRGYYDTTEADYSAYPAGFYDLYAEQTAYLLNANISTYTSNGTVGSGLNKICSNIYYAGIKFIKDAANNQDEYIVQWFRNSLPVSSGEVTSPAISVYKTSDGLALTANRVLTQTSVHNGVLRYNEASSLAVSGEPYLAITSGTIDGSLRIWSNPIGLDSL